MALHVEIARSPAEVAAVLPEWRDFMATRVDTRDFRSHPTLVAFEVEEGGAAPYVVLLRESGLLQCVGAFSVKRSRLRVQLSVFTLATVELRMMRPFGSGFTFARGADVERCLEAGLAALESAEFDMCFLHALDVGSPLWTHCASHAGAPNGLRYARATDIIDESFDLTLPLEHSEYLASLGAKTRAALKRRARRAVDAHGATLSRITEPDAVRAFLDSVDEIYRDSWQSRTFGAKRRNTPREIARLEHVARQGWLRSYLLSGPQGPLAFQFGFQVEGTYHAADFAYARSAATLGPGSVLMFLMLEDLYRHRRPETVDLGAGDSPQKHTFRATSRGIADYYVCRGRRWHNLVRTQRALAAVEAAVRRSLVLAGIDAHVRRVLKRKH